MSRLVRYFWMALKLLIVGMLSSLLAVVRFLLRTPQPLASLVPGEERLYKWTHGQVFYKVSGPVDALPVVLLHEPGIGASGYEMRQLVPGLARQYRVYVPDLPGCGLSERPHMDYTAATYATFCQDFLRDVVGRPGVVLAYGQSCNYAVAVAASEPELCQRLILLSPAELSQETRADRWWLAMAGIPLYDLWLYALLTRRPVLRWLLARRRAIPYGQVSTLDLDVCSVAAHQRGAHYVALAWLAGRLHLELGSHDAQLKQPVLVIWGLQTPRERRAVDSALQLSAQTEVAYINDGGRSVQEERPGRVVQAIQSWYKPVLPASKGLTVATTKAIATVETVEGIKETESEKKEKGRREERKQEGHAEGGKAAKSGSEVIGKEEKQEGTERIGEATEERVVEGEKQKEEGGKVEAKEVGEAHQEVAYCVKCREKREMLGVKRIVTKNGRPALEGTCAVCGTRLFRFIAGAKEKNV